MSSNSLSSRIASRMHAMVVKVAETKVELVRGLRVEPQVSEKCGGGAVGFQVTAGKDQFGDPKAK